MNDGCPLARERVISGNWFQVLLQLESLLSEGKGEWICLGSPSRHTWNRQALNDGIEEFPKLLLNHQVWAFMLSLIDRKPYAFFRRKDLLANLFQLAIDQRRRVMFICQEGKKPLPSRLRNGAVAQQSVVLSDAENLRYLADRIVEENIFVVVNTSNRFRAEDRKSLQRQTKKSLLWVDAPKQASGWTEIAKNILRFACYRSKVPHHIAQWANRFSLRSK